MRCRYESRIVSGEEASYKRGVEEGIAYAISLMEISLNNTLGLGKGRMCKVMEEYFRLDEYCRKDPDSGSVGVVKRLREIHKNNDIR